MATISIRTSDETKTSFESFCESLGITVSAAINMFMKTSLRENRIPFELRADPFWNDENQQRLKTSMIHAKEGKLSKHDLSEVM